MNPDDISLWAKQFHHELRLKWEELYKKEPKLEHGFQGFYSPVSYQPELMVLGLNPGGSKNDFDIRDCEDIPLIHSYYEYKYPLAEKMKSFFEGSLEPLLRNSVKTNVIFFRSKNMDEWYKLNPVIRKEAEDFCNQKVLELINTLKPKRLLLEGIGSYNIIHNVLGLSDENKNVIAPKRKIVIHNEKDDLKIMGIIHPTGARPRVSNEEFEIIKEAVMKFALVQLPEG